MNSIVLVLFFVVLAYYLFLGPFQESEVTEAQQQYRRKLLIPGVVCLLSYCFLLLTINIVPIGQAERIFLTIVLPIPFVTVLLYYGRRFCPHSPEYPSTATIVIVFGILFTCLVLVAVWGYHVRLDSDREVQEIRQELIRARSRAEPPPGEILEERIERLKSQLVPDVPELDK